MNLNDIRQEALRVDDGPSEELPFRMAEVGEHLDEALSDSRTLADVSRKVVTAAHNLSCRAVMGASPLGQRLAGAAVALSGNGLRVYSPAEDAGAVLIVDGIRATGTSIRWARETLYRAGVERTPAVVVLDVPGGEESTDPEDQVVVLS